MTRREHRSERPQTLKIPVRLGRRAGGNRGRGAGPGARHPGLHRQALQDPERLDGAHPGDRSAGARESSRHGLRQPQRGPDRGVPSPEGAESERCGKSMAPGEACSQPVEKKASVNFIKRVVAGPGDEIYIQNGHVYRKAKGTTKFVPENDSYIRECGANPECTFSKPITIPEGKWFMLGDNRGESDDSRFWGPVPTAWIIGVA